jgi:hypothetical protein
MGTTPHRGRNSFHGIPSNIYKMKMFQTKFYILITSVSQKERDHWENQDVGEWTISKWILER